LHSHAPDGPLLLALREPARLAELAEPAWRDLLAQARACGLLARIERLVVETGLLHRIPATARVHLAEARCFLRRNQTDVRFEAHRVARALTGLNTPVLLLKGGAYLLAGLPPARSHFASDLDIMVPQEHLGLVERTLLAAGWRRGAVTDYDDRYYRNWMHELPPLWHPERLFALDLHHAILPSTSRYKPDTEALFAAAVPLNDHPFKVLCPADMVLHGAAHLFTEEFVSALRQLADLHDLLEHFGRTEGFWDDLLERSRRHGLGRILYYLLRYARQVLATEVPHEVRAAAEAYRPNLVVRAIIDAAVLSALRPAAFGEEDRARDIAVWILYLRSHWLKMPPLVLARHILVKTALRLRSRLGIPGARSAAGAN
jgi:hypothetical protein